MVLVSSLNPKISFASQDHNRPYGRFGTDRSATDIYEWHAGRVRLISSGQGDDNAVFAGASTDGRDVFFASSSSLSLFDVDGDVDIYDARVDGGALKADRAEVPCSADACQGVQAALPGALTPATSRQGDQEGSHQRKKRRCLRSGRPGKRAIQQRQASCKKEKSKKRHAKTDRSVGK